MPTRRRFLAASAALGAAACASWFGHRHLNRPPALSLVKAGLPAGHLLRDGRMSAPPSSTHRCQTLILGSGAAGLAAAWRLHKGGERDFLLADGLERNGNAAARQYGGTAAPTGAHYLALPSAQSTAVRMMLADLGILQGFDSAGEPLFADTDLVHAPAERLLYRGAWRDGLLPAHDADSQRFFRLTAALKHAFGADGKKLFAIPIAESSADLTWRQWDGLTFAQWLEREKYRSETLLWYLDYCCRDDYGAGIAQVSAFAGLHYFCARGNRSDSVLTWPDGLNHLAEALRRRTGLRDLPALPPQAQWHFRQPAACAAFAVKIREHADRVEVWLRGTADGKTVRVLARRVVCAMPLNVAARIVENAADYGFGRLPETAPWLVANFVLDGFPRERGSELAWDNVVYGTRGLGYVVATHQLIRAAKPAQTVFTAYAALNDEPPAQTRRRLLAADADSLLPLAAQDLTAAYGKRFWQHVREVDLTVRGHAMSIPAPGYLSLPALTALRQHRSRLLFAHSDLSGYSVFEEAAYWGVRAAEMLLAAA